MTNILYLVKELRDFGATMEERLGVFLLNSMGTHVSIHIFKLHPKISVGLLQG